MMQYPSILGSVKAPLGRPCLGFVKYDGSNLRWEWSPKRGWEKFGTRRHLFDQTDPVFGEAIPLFLDRLGKEITDRVKDEHRGVQRITAFTEFFGPNSFAGSHVPGEPKELKLFDVFLFQKGFIPPKKFVAMFGDLPQTAEVVYEGNVTKQLVMDVKKGKFKVDEGLILKGADFMVKVKTDEYFRRLRHKYPERWQEYGE